MSRSAIVLVLSSFWDFPFLGRSPFSAYTRSSICCIFPSILFALTLFRVSSLFPLHFIHIELTNFSRSFDSLTLYILASTAFLIVLLIPKYYCSSPNPLYHR